MNKQKIQWTEIFEDDKVSLPTEPCICIVQLDNGLNVFAAWVNCTKTWLIKEYNSIPQRFIKLKNLT